MGHTSKVGHVTETVPSIPARAPAQRSTSHAVRQGWLQGSRQQGRVGGGEGGSWLTWAAQPALHHSVHATPSPLTA